MPNITSRTSTSTLWGWRINKGGTEAAPKWVTLGGAPKGFELGKQLVIRWRVAADIYEVPLLGASEVPHCGELLDAIAWDSSYEGEALLEIEGVFYRFGRGKKYKSPQLIPLEFPPAYAELTTKVKEVIAEERKSAALMLELGASLAHKYGGW